MTEEQEDKIRQIKALAFIISTIEKPAEIPTEYIKEIGFLILGITDEII